MSPLGRETSYAPAVNLKLSDSEITSVCRELLVRDPTVSGRALRSELKRRLGSAGRKDRVYGLWRALRAEYAAQSAKATEIVELEAQLFEARQQIAVLEMSLFDTEQRALRSEERERTHQDRWANEMYELRAEVQRLRSLGMR